jgi:hypothetical protein
MKTPLVPIQVPSIYKNATGQRVPVPTRMAKCTPDMYTAILKVGAEVEALGGKLYLSDLFRSYEMQFQAHMDYKSGKKAAFSPAPGGSLHEAGRSLDLDLEGLKIPLAKFWEVGAKHGLTPIITEPNPKMKEAWHFDCRGSHGKVYEYYASGKGKDQKPYAAMAASAILGAGLTHDAFKGREAEAALQSHLIKLGHEIGNMDGILGAKSFEALEKIGVARGEPLAMLEALEHLIQKAFPDEYRMTQPPMETVAVPAHVIS